MEMNLGEFLDRMSIVIHKAQKIGSESYPEFIKFCEEFLLETPTKNFEEIIKALRELYEINGEIWKLESDIRKGKEKELGLQEVGRRALAIRDWNSKRVAVQNKIAKKFGGFKNIKKDHRSAT